MKIRALVADTLGQRAFWVYLGVGGFTFGVDFGSYALMVYGLGLVPPAAKAISYVLSLMVHFTLNKYVTFGGGVRSVGRQLGTYLVVAAVCGVVAVAVVAALTRWLPQHPMLANLVAVAVTTPLSFLGHRTYTFGGKSLRESVGFGRWRVGQWLGLSAPRPVLLLFGAALVLRWWPVWFDWPESHQSDPERETLNQAFRVINLHEPWSRLYDRPQGVLRIMTYGDLPAFVAVPVCVVGGVIAKATGHFRSWGDLGKWGFGEGRPSLVVACRAVFALWAALGVLVAYNCGREWGRPAAGVWAAALLTVSPLHAQNAHLAACDAISTTMYLLALLFWLRALKSLTLASAWWAGAWCGAAMAVKQFLFPLALVLLVVLALAQLPEPAGLRRRVGLMAWGALGMLATFAVCWPTFVRHPLWELFYLTENRNMTWVFRPEPLQTFRTFIGGTVGWVGLVAVLVGLVPLGPRASRSHPPGAGWGPERTPFGPSGKAAVVIALFPLICVLTMGTAQAVADRFFAGVAGAVVIPAGLGAERLGQLVWGLRDLRWRSVAAGAFAVALLGPLAVRSVGWDVTHTLPGRSYEPNRVRAFLSQVTKPGEVVFSVIPDCCPEGRPWQKLPVNIRDFKGGRCDTMRSLLEGPRTRWAARLLLGAARVEELKREAQHIWNEASADPTSYYAPMAVARFPRLAELGTTGTQWIVLRPGEIELTRPETWRRTWCPGYWKTFGAFHAELQRRAVRVGTPQGWEVWEVQEPGARRRQVGAADSS